MTPRQRLKFLKQIQSHLSAAEIIYEQGENAASDSPDGPDDFASWNLQSEIQEVLGTTNKEIAECQKAIAFAVIGHDHRIEKEERKEERKRRKGKK